MFAPGSQVRRFARKARTSVSSVRSVSVHVCRSVDVQRACVCVFVRASVLCRRQRLFVFSASRVATRRPPSCCVCVCVCVFVCLCLRRMRPTLSRNSVPGVLTEWCLGSRGQRMANECGVRGGILCIELVVSVGIVSGKYCNQPPSCRCVRIDQ